MNISIGEKKVFGGAAPRYKRLKDYRRCRGVIVGIRAWLMTGLTMKVLIPLHYRDSWYQSSVGAGEQGCS